MIEVIYDNSEEEEEAGELKGIRLPKNIRQVGVPQGNRKIYVEDYVMTYLNQLSKPETTYARGAILLGEYKKSNHQGVLFISGAIEAQNIEFDMEETEFSNEVWSHIYDDVKRFFPELEVVGWFLSRMGFSTQINEKINRIHIENFPGRDKALFIIDSLEGEDAWYLCDNGELKRQSGYYIYYTRNDAMQNYMMTQRSYMVEAETDVAERDQDLLDAYRKRLEQRRVPQIEKEKKSIGFFYVASSILTVACLGLGVTAISNYDRLKNLEVAFQRMAVMTDNGVNQGNMANGNTTSDDFETNVISVGANVSKNESENGLENEAKSDVRNTSVSSSNSDSSSTTSDENNMTSNVDAKVDSSITTDNNPDANQDSSQNDSNTSSANTSVIDVASGVPQYYTVQEGDTLSSISFSAYHSILYVDQIMEANNMKNGDDIYVGQTILIPSAQ